MRTNRVALLEHEKSITDKEPFIFDFTLTGVNKEAKIEQTFDDAIESLAKCADKTARYTIPVETWHKTNAPTMDEWEAFWRATAYK